MARAREAAAREAQELAQQRAAQEQELLLAAEARVTAELAASHAQAALAEAEANALQAASAAHAAVQREQEFAAARAARARQTEDRAAARLDSAKALAEAEKKKYRADEQALKSAAESARIEAEAADLVRQRRADSTKRAALNGERRRIELARIVAGLRKVSTPFALAAVAFALGFGVNALLFQSDSQIDRQSALGLVTSQSGPPAARLPLKMDADYAGFAARAASRVRTSR